MLAVDSDTVLVDDRAPFAVLYSHRIGSRWNRLIFCNLIVVEANASREAIRAHKRPPSGIIEGVHFLIVASVGEEDFVAVVVEFC